jgi:hypothetical protein
MVCIGPGEDLLLRESGEPLSVPDPAVFFEESCEGRTAGQTTAALAQGSVDAFPFFSGVPWDRTSFDFRPPASVAEISICPGENLLQG